MIASPTEDHVVERRWRKHYAERIEAGRRKHEKRLKNHRLLVDLDRGRALEFRGRKYGVPPVPWDVALAILALEEREDELGAQPSPDLEGWALWYRDAAEMFKRGAMPWELYVAEWLEPRERSRLERWRLERIRRRWESSPSPLLNAPRTEVAKALRFFSMCRRLDESLSWESPVLPGTSHATSRDSSTTSRSGATSAAGRAAGNTS